MFTFGPLSKHLEWDKKGERCSAFMLLLKGKTIAIFDLNLFTLQCFFKLSTNANANIRNESIKVTNKQKGQNISKNQLMISYKGRPIWTVLTLFIWFNLVLNCISLKKDSICYYIYSLYFWVESKDLINIMLPYSTISFHWFSLQYLEMIFSRVLGTKKGIGIRCISIQHCLLEQTLFLVKSLPTSVQG